MTDVPELPDSNDPFEVLGVDHSADELALRRAYVRLIKIHRPDRSPENFALVRSAYDAAREAIQWRRYEHDGSDDYDEHDDYEDDYEEDNDAGERAEPTIEGRTEAYADPGPGGETEEEADWRPVPVAGSTQQERGAERMSVSASISSAWDAFAQGEDARTVLLRLREPYDDKRIAMHRALLSDAGGIGYREEVLSSLRAGRPVVDWLVDVLTSKEIHALVVEDDFAWGTLRRQDVRPVAAQLMRVRLHVHMIRGRLDRAVLEVLDDEFVDDAESNHILAWAGQEVLAVSAWAGVELVEQLDRRYGVSAAADFEFLSPPDHRAAAAALREPWLIWRREFKSFKVLRRFLVLAPVLGDELLGELRDDLASDYLDRAGVYAAGFYRMHEKAPELLERFILAAESLSGPEPADARTRVREANSLRHLDRRLDEGWTRSGHSAYVDTVRPALTRVVVEEGLSPQWIVEMLVHDDHALTWLAQHAQSIAEERMLAALYACGRLAGAD